ncbi:hypothetical protein SB861_46230 [Paraburkholderia sp. SIMBA_049]
MTELLRSGELTFSAQTGEKPMSVADFPSATLVARLFGLSSAYDFVGAWRRLDAS